MLTFDNFKDDEIFMELGDMDVQMMPVDDFYPKPQGDTGKVKMLKKMQRPANKWVLSESVRRADCTHMHYWKKAGGDQNRLDNELVDSLHPKSSSNVPSAAPATAVAAAVGAPGNRSKPARFVKYTEEEY